MALDDERDAVRAFGERVWPQAESVLQDLFMYFSRTAERYNVTEEEQVDAVRRFIGDDLADWYIEWLDGADV